MNKADKSAFPHPRILLKGDEIGLTKREYFAAIALQGYISYSGGKPNEKNWEEIAEYAVNQADSLLEALEEK